MDENTKTSALRAKGLQQAAERYLTVLRENGGLKETIDSAKMLKMFMDNMQADLRFQQLNG